MENPPTAETASAGNGTGADPDVPEFISSFDHWFQKILDRSMPHVRERWLGLLFLSFVYVIRVWFAQGFYLVTYGLGIFALSRLVAFLSPMVDPVIEELMDEQGPSLPTRSTDEFRPFVRKLPEFKFWYALVKAFCIAFLMTFFSIFDLHVFWPMLVSYFCGITFITMKQQIEHMIKYKYLPFSFGKERYDRQMGASVE